MQPTSEQIRQALSHVRYEIESLLQTPEYDASNKALEESVYFRKMAHCRALYHSFRKRASERQDKGNLVDDDVIAEDYSFPAKDVYGKYSSALLSRFNKDLLHLTYTRLQRTRETKPWPMDRLFPPVAQRAQEFIDHILSLEPTKIDEAERKKWFALKKDVRVKIPLQQNTSNVAEPIIWRVEMKES